MLASTAMATTATEAVLMPASASLKPSSRYQGMKGSMHRLVDSSRVAFCRVAYVVRTIVASSSKALRPLAPSDQVHGAIAQTEIEEIA